MNRIEAIHTEYVRPSRTIEIIKVWKQDKAEVLFIYNHDGLYFKVFKSIIDLGEYLFNNKKTFFKEFENEQELDVYLEKVDIANLNEKHGKFKK